MPSDGHCQFSDCKQAGLYFKRLDKHLKCCHPGKTMKDNLNRPIQIPLQRSLAQSTDRRRQPCTVLGCHYYGVPILRLDRHRKKVHETRDCQKMEDSVVAECSFSEEEDKSNKECFSAKIATIISNL